MISYGYIPEEDKGPKRFIKRIMRRSLRWLLLPIFDELNTYNEYGALLKKNSKQNDSNTIRAKCSNRDIFSDNQLHSTLIKAKKGTLIKPCYNECDTVIFFSASDTYTSILGVLINSIIVNSNKSEVYDLVILETDMSTQHMNMINSLGKDHANVSIRFVDVNDLIEVEQLEECSNGFTFFSFLRLLAPELFGKYKKALYLDSDTIVDVDIAEIYNITMDGYLIGGAIDVAFQAFHYRENISYYQSIGLYDCNTYINSGVLLINVDEFRKSFSDDFFLNKAKEYTYKWPDQDLLNVFCKGRIKCIDIAWNVFSLDEWLATRLEEELSDDLYIEYTLSRDCPKIIHFIMRRTLNRVPIGDYAEVYWKYAKNTPFYENLIFE